ncbi:discoidin domain-containing protein [Eubacterium sp. LMAG:50]|uniref:discoidin domain-containing protein n=1 Tax=Eubacterium sp. LMAG:50 TaxID=1969563 RepID=UPI0025B82CFB|nr:discoidin domain-containing protein [Eubacterium sp. LMAG:50]
MKIRKGIKLACSYGLAAAMVVTSATGYQVKNVSAADQYGIALLDGEEAVPEGYTLLNEGWNPLGENLIYKVGDKNDVDGSEWNLYSGNSWSGVSAAAKDGADGQNTVSVYVINTAAQAWGLQLEKVFGNLEGGKFYKYNIKYTVDGTENSWEEMAIADENGQIKVTKDLSGVVKAGQTFTVTDVTIEEVTVSDEVRWLTTDRNLAYQKSSSVSNYKEGNNDSTTLTDGIWYKWNGNYVGVTTPGYFEVDLGESYAASSIDEVVVWFRNGRGELYPANGFDIQFGDTIFKTVASVTEYPAGASIDQKDGSQYMVAKVLDKDSLKGNVRKVRINVNQAVNWGTQITEIAVFSENPQGPVEMEKASAPAGVTATSDAYNSITYSVEAAEGQVEAGYKYMVYAGDKVIGDNVEAGKSYTKTGVDAGEYTITARAVCDDMDVSDAIEATETVKVTDISELVTGANNIANIKNNPEAKITEVSSYYNDEYTIDNAGVAIDGSIASGEGSDVAIRTAGGQEASVVLDLGNSYIPSQFEKLVLAYSNPRTYASDTKVEFSLDGEKYTTVAESTGYTCKKDNAGTADLNIIDLDLKDYAEAGVRYVKVSLSGGSNGWGYVINEIGVGLNVTVDDAKVYTTKTPVDAPVIESKTYTGETVVADIEDTDDYTVTKNEGGVDVGTYDVELTLKDADNYYWSDDNKAKATTKTVKFEITKADRTAPEGIESVASTLEENADGKITGVTDEMEYRAEGEEEYTAVTGTEIANVKAGKYFVRYADSKNYNTSEDAEVEVGTGRKLNVTLTNGTGYTLTTEDEASVVYGTEYTVKLELAAGYTKDSKPVVKANGVEVVVAEDGTYKIEIKEDTEITAEGVIEDIPETTKAPETTTAVPTTAAPTAAPTAVPTPTATTAATTAAAPSRVTVKKAAIKKATKKKSAKKASIELKKVNGAAGYQVKVSTSKKFDKKTTVTVNAKSVKVTVKKLKANKTYFVKARAYKKVSGSKVYGKWSKVVKVKNN